MNRLLKFTLAAALLVTGISYLPGCNGANDHAISQLNDGPRGFMIKTLTRGSRNRKYGLFIPTTYNSSNKYPVIIFLHGVGEGGNDAHANLRVGLAPFVAARAADFPFICIFPQSDNGSWDENSENATDVIAELDEVSKNFAVDQDRVSLTGLSTGGYGTWAIGAKYKSRFAALVPMGSNASADKYLADLVGMPIWSFHNSGDMFAASWNDSGMVSKLKTLGGNAQYTEYSAMGHDCWETAYQDGELFAWLLQQRRHGSSPVHTSSSITPVHATVPVASSAAHSNMAASVNTPY